MTVAANPSEVSYTENGVTLAFAAPFRFLDPTHLVVERIVAGSLVELDYGPEWSATGGSTDAGGTVTLVASIAGATLRIRRVTPRAQQTDYATGDIFPAETHEAALDRQMLIDQEQDVSIGDLQTRALLAAPGESGGELPTDMAGGYLAFDAEGRPIRSGGTGADAGLREDLAEPTGARLVGTKTGISVQAALDALGVAGQCLIVPLIGQSLTLGRAPQVTAPGAVPDNLYMPLGGPEWPSVNAPAPLDPSGRPVVPANFASFVPYVPLAGVEGLAPGMAYQLREAGWQTVVTFSTGSGGTSIGSHLAGGTNGGAGGPYLANLHAFLYHAVKWARARGLEPVIKPVLIQGHADADLFNDGGTAGIETTQAQYVAALVKFKRDLNIACSLALGEPWNGVLHMTPLLSGHGTLLTLTGRKAVVAAQLQAASAIGGSAVGGIRLLPPHSQFAPLFEADLIHPGGQAYRYYGEVIGAALAQGDRTVPWMTGKTTISATQVRLTFSEAIEVSALVAEASTAGVKGGFEAYTAGGVQIPLTAVAQEGTKTLLVTMGSTATLDKIRSGLTQETVGTADKMPRTRAASPVPLATAQDGTALGVFSIPQEI